MDEFPTLVSRPEGEDDLKVEAKPFLKSNTIRTTEIKAIREWRPNG